MKFIFTFLLIMFSLKNSSASEENRIHARSVCMNMYETMRTMNKEAVDLQKLSLGIEFCTRYVAENIELNRFIKINNKEMISNISCAAGVDAYGTINKWPQSKINQYAKLCFVK